MTKGIVVPGRTFFEKAFGSGINEFHEILYMPETYIVYRYFFEGVGLTEMWRKTFNSLTAKQKELALPIIERNDFSNVCHVTSNKKLLELFRHYTIRKEDVSESDINYKLNRSFEILSKKISSWN